MANSRLQSKVSVWLFSPCCQISTIEAKHRMGVRLKYSACQLVMFVLVILLTCYATPLSAQTKLSWNTFRLPGYYNEPGAAKGIADKILDFYIRQLPEYDHEVLEVPIVRIFQTMTETTQGGYLGPGKTRIPPEQLNKVHTSSVHLVMPPAGIVIRKEDKDTFLADNTDVSVRSLLYGERPLVFCWISGATYHPAIRKAVDDYVAEHPEHPNVYFWSNIRKEIFDMLIKKRIDYFPNHAISFQYECSQRPDCAEKLMFVPVSEAKGDVLTYTFAAKTKVGENVVSQLDKIHQSQEYKAFLKKVISQHYPANLVEKYTTKNMNLVGTAMGE